MLTHKSRQGRKKTSYYLLKRSLPATPAMKTCPYCGQEHEDTIATCHECGTELSLVGKTADKSDALSRIISSHKTAAHSSSRQVIFTCLGIIFISTAVIMAAGRLFFDLQASAHGGPIGKPGIFAVGILFIPIFLLWVVVNFFFSLAICSSRFPTLKQTIIVGLLAFSLSVLCFWQRDLRYFLPATILRHSIGPPLGGYVGAFVQFLLGAILLGWVSIWLQKIKRISRTRPPMPCPAGNQRT